MGACIAYGTARARTKEKAFQKVVKELHYAYGHDSYNGTLTTCTLKKDVTHIFTKLSDDEFEAWLEKNVEKWEAVAWRVRGTKTCWFFWGLASC